jgi:hypothetical protein
MTTSRLDELLKKMSEIAAAVNSFTSPDVQLLAFKTLADAASGNAHKFSPDTIPPILSAPVDESAKSTKQKKKAAPSSSVALKLLGDLDLAPKGKQSIKEFFEAKQPKSDPQKYCAILYYLKNVLGIQKVSLDHFYTAFKYLEIKVPNIYVGLRNTRIRNGWVDPTDSDDVKMTLNGENFIEHEIAKKKGPK